MSRLHWEYKAAAHLVWGGGVGKRRLPGGNGIKERLEGVCQRLRGGT